MNQIRPPESDEGPFSHSRQHLTQQRILAHLSKAIAGKSHPCPLQNRGWKCWQKSSSKRVTVAGQQLSQIQDFKSPPRNRVEVVIQNFHKICDTRTLNVSASVTFVFFPSEVKCRERSGGKKEKFTKFLANGGATEYMYVHIHLLPLGNCFDGYFSDSHNCCLNTRFLIFP